MIIGFFCDHNFLVGPEDSVYTTGTLDSQFWSRYLNNGADKVIVVGRNSGAPKPDAVKSNAKHVTYRFGSSLSSLKGLMGWCDESTIMDTVKDVDKVVVRLPSEIGYKAVKYANKFGKPVACEVVACPKDALQYHGSTQARIYSYLAAYRMKKYVGRCEAALYVTRSELQRRYPNSQFTVNASNVEIQEVKNDCVAKRISRFRDRIPALGLKICLVGTLENKSKGIDVAIKSLAGKPHRLTVIGRGDHQEYSRLAAKLGVNARFLGFVSDRATLLSELDDSDIYIQPSFQEGLSRATLEAMSRGCPTLTSSAGGFSEITHPKFIHTPGDFEALSRHIDAAANEKSMRELILHSLKISETYLDSTVNKSRAFFYRTFFGI